MRRIDFDGADLFICGEGDWRNFRSAACKKEPETAEWIRRSAGENTVFYDIGACVGSYSLIAAALGATVHAFEPVAVNYAQLQLNVWLNSADRVSAWPVAMVSRTGPVSIELSSPRPGAASHTVRDLPLPIRDHNHRQIQPAIGVMLDRFIADFHLPQPTDIKVDVDGGEVAVLEGGRAALKGARSVMVEVGPGTEPSVAAILQAAGLERTGRWPRSGRQSNCLYERR